MTSRDSSASNAQDDSWTPEWSGVSLDSAEIDIEPHPLNIPGHYGDVYRGNHIKHEPLALKRLRIGSSDDDMARIRMFLREGRTWQDLAHPNVLPFLGVANLGGSLYLVSPFAEHGTVVGYLQQNPTTDRRQFIRDIAEALGFLHSKEIIHGDVKGRNVLISPNIRAQVCDFGLARYVYDTTSTAMPGAGTVRWSSPEVLCGQPKSYASDVYAFGMTIAEILSGQPPFPEYNDNVAVITAIMLKGERPSKLPSESLDGASYANEWNVAEQAWATDANERPPIDRIVELLSSVSIQTSDHMSPEVVTFRELVKSSRNIAVLAGPGLSLASGLKIQRDSDHGWRGRRIASLISPRILKDQPSLVWKFYYDRYTAAQDGPINEAHRALAALSKDRVLWSNTKSSYDNQEPSLTLIDDTIDGLLDRAVREVNTSNEDVPDSTSDISIRLHGSVLPMRCGKCGNVARDPEGENTSDRWLSYLAELQQHYRATGVDEVVPDDRLPRCSRRHLSVFTLSPNDVENSVTKERPCGGIYRPGVVLFGESLTKFPTIRSRLEQCDLLIIAGTSSMSYPAGRMVPIVKQRGGRVAVFNEAVGFEESPDFMFLGPCVETVPNVLGLPISD